LIIKIVGKVVRARHKAVVTNIPSTCVLDKPGVLQDSDCVAKLEQKKRVAEFMGSSKTYQDRKWKKIFPSLKKDTGHFLIR